MRWDDLVRGANSTCFECLAGPFQMHTGTSTVLVGAHSRAVRSAKPWPRIDHFTCYEQGLIFGGCLSTGIWVLLSLVWRSPGQFRQVDPPDYLNQAIRQQPANEKGPAW